MNRSPRNTLLTGPAAAFAAAFLTAAATGQVLTPPPAAPAEEPAYTPPPRAPQVQARPQPRVTQQPQSGAAPARPNARVVAPDVPFRNPAFPIDVAPGEQFDGPVIRYEQPIQYAAIRYNPLIGEDEVERIAELVRRRRIENEKIAMSNLDLVKRIRGGFVETMSVQDIEGMAEVTKALQPILNPESVIDAAVKANLLPATTRALHNEIIRAYQTAFQADLKDTVSDAELTDAFLQMVMRDTTYEIENAYLDMLAEATTRMPAVLSGIELPGENAAELRNLPASDRGALADDVDARHDVASKVFSALRGLATNTERDFLRRIVETRSEDQGPFLPEIRIDRPDDQGEGS
ncbi:MAG: hypothetical protein AAF235_02500 [Planctomycetota bacterium]